MKTVAFGLAALIGLALPAVAGPKDQIQLAQASGGVFYSIKRIDDLQSAYEDIVAQMRTAYTITFSSNADASAHRRVRVRANRDGASVRLSPAVSTH